MTETLELFLVSVVNMQDSKTLQESPCPLLGNGPRRRSSQLSKLSSMFSNNLVIMTWLKITSRRLSSVKQGYWT